jgi:hypothetical protein
MNFGNSTFCLAESVEKGRCVCAVRPLEANTIILRESTTAIVIYPAARTLFCAYCTNKLLKNGVNILILINFFF